MIIFADRVVLGDGVREPLAVKSAEIVVEGSRIRSVRPVERAQWTSSPEALDLGDRVVCPAFVNAHTHLALNAFRGLTQLQNLRGNMVENLFYRLEENLSPEDVRAFARMGAYESLDNGVALVWDHYYGDVQLAEAAADVGLCAVVAPTLQDSGGPGTKLLDSQLRATEELDAAQWQRRGIWPALGPHATDTVSAELWRRVGELAQERSWVVHAHVAQSIEEYERAQDTHGCSPVELLERCGVLDARGLFVHAIYTSETDLRRLNPDRHMLGFCPLSQAQFGFPAHVGSWTEAGLPWCVATDCAPTNDAMNVQRELPFVAATRAFAATHSSEYARFRSEGGVDVAAEVERRRVNAIDAYGSFSEPDFLLSKVLSVPGRLHSSMTAGVIEPGALANVLVLDPDHPCMWPSLGILRTLALSDTRDAIERMMVLGVWREGESERAQRSAHAQDAQSRLEHHLKSIGFL